MPRIAAFLALLLCAGQLPAESAVEVAYGTHPRQRMDVYRVAGAKQPTAVVVYLPGGAWVSGGKAERAALAPAFRAHGVALTVVEYRLSGNGGIRFPEHARDAAAAIDLVAKRAKEWGIDPNRIFVVGHSAGAHSAAVLARGEGFEATAKRVRGFVGIAGIYDLPALVKRWPGYRDWFVTAAFGPETDWKKASPASYPKRSEAPWLLIHSKGDELVDVPQTEAFAKALVEGKSKAETFYPANRQHFEIIERLSEKGDPVMTRILKFVDET